MRIELVVLVVLVAVAVAEDEPKGALVSIDTETREIHFEIDGGDDHTFVPCKKRKMGGKKGPEDLDTFRGQCHEGQDVIVIRLTSSEEGGKRDFDGPGLASIDGAAYKLKLNGEITEKDGQLTFRVSLEAPETNSATKTKTSDEDEVQAPPEADEEATQIEEHGKRALQRRKRANYNQLWLELGIYVDQGFWDTYSQKYGSQAEAKINSFVEAIIDVMESDYNGLNPRININVNVLEIWKTQPDFSAEGKPGGDIYKYLDHLARSDYNPSKKNVDHAMILSGFELQKTYILGLAYTTRICNSPSWAVSVMNIMNMGAGEVVVHEVGHSFGAFHDSDKGHEFEKECPSRGYVMAAVASSDQTKDLKWSECSIKRIKYEIKQWDKKNINCLINKPSDADDNSDNGDNNNNGGNNGNNGGNNGGNGNCQDKDAEFCKNNEVYPGGKYGYLCTDWPSYAARCKKSCKMC